MQEVKPSAWRRNISCPTRPSGGFYFLHPLLVLWQTSCTPDEKRFNQGASSEYDVVTLRFYQPVSRSPNRSILFFEFWSPPVWQHLPRLEPHILLKVDDDSPVLNPARLFAAAILYVKPSEQLTQVIISPMDRLDSTGRPTCTKNFWALKTARCRPIHFRLP